MNSASSPSFNSDNSSLSVKSDPLITSSPSFFGHNVYDEESMEQEYLYSEGEEPNRNLNETSKNTTCKQKRKRIPFTVEEDEKITEGHIKFGGEWEEIIRWGHLERTPQQLRDRYKRLQKKREEKGTSTGNQAKSEKHKKSQKNKNKPHTPDSIKNNENSDSLLNVNKRRKIESGSETGVEQKLEGESPETRGSPKTKEEIGQDVKSREEELRRREEDCRKREEEVKKKELKLKDLEKIVKKEKDRERQETKEQKGYKEVAEGELKRVLIKMAEIEKRQKRSQCLSNNSRLGHITFERHGIDFGEAWQFGSEFADLQRKFTDLAQLKQLILNQKKLVEGKANAHSSEPDHQILLENEILRIRLLNLEKEERYLQEEKERLMTQKNLQLRELKRLSDEERSRFKNYPLLENRYLLLCLLGRGGFSEVYQAYDLKELRRVACKLHSFNNEWSEQKKKSYSKHVLREYDIHKSVNHPQVVRLFDVFEVDENSLCTVLEFCDGGDLDFYLKNYKTLCERESRSIISQIFCGLKYLNSQKRPIIHYDLKPGNILFHEGHVKITDFGLSKTMTEGSDGTELTSQGAGTYWYLPPECFESGTTMISSKVDVWSAGVIFYQMLYGKKPFGNNMSQQKLLREGIISNAVEVDFPPDPHVSEPTKVGLFRP
eukprot:TRINITY_DN879_c0_g1_i2.p1 TRINITY_DN879_c0_g1~~TRINITY_DN879_c0_g1_i2.p1  ORF type:complete len:661 (-),score=170.81 TRINITY_DN879_c0_g1_i2:313-2295(-)